MREKYITKSRNIGSFPHTYEKCVEQRTLFVCNMLEMNEVKLCLLDMI